MRLLADENMHAVVVERLCKAGFEVEWIRHTSPGALDAEILARPDIGEFIFITHDRDFGDLAFNKRMPTPRTILYTRIPHREPDLNASLLIALLEAGVPLGQMITITTDGNRIRPFPTGASYG